MMLLITKNKSTTRNGNRQSIRFTDSDSTASSFLLELVSNSTNESKYIASSEFGTLIGDRPRWVQFSIETGTSESQGATPVYNLSGAKYPEGFYSYKIYAQVTEFNFSPIGLNLVNTGIAFLQDEDGAFTEATYTSNPDSVEGYTYYTE